MPRTRWHVAVAAVLDDAQFFGPPAAWREVLDLDQVVAGLQDVGFVLPVQPRGHPPANRYGRPMTHAEQVHYGLVSGEVPE